MKNITKWIWKKMYDQKKWRQMKFWMTYIRNNQVMDKLKNWQLNINVRVT